MFDFVVVWIAAFVCLAYATYFFGLMLIACMNLGFQGAEKLSLMVIIPTLAALWFLLIDFAPFKVVML